MCTNDLIQVLVENFLMCFSNKTTFCFCFFFLNKQNSPSLLDYKTYIYKIQIQYAQ